MALRRAFSPMWSWASKKYQAAVAEKLKDYGLRYDDLYDPLIDTDVDEALRRVTKEERLARNARIKRAMDLSMKHEKLPKELRDKQTPFLMYLEEDLKQVKEERKERLELGVGQPFQRQLT